MWIIHRLWMMGEEIQRIDLPRFLDDKAKTFLLKRAKFEQKYAEKQVLQKIMLEIYRVTMDQKGDQPTDERQRIAELTDLSTCLPGRAGAFKSKTREEDFPFLDYSYYNWEDYQPAQAAKGRVRFSLKDLDEESPLRRRGGAGGHLQLLAHWRWLRSCFLHSSSAAGLMTNPC